MNDREDNFRSEFFETLADKCGDGYGWLVAFVVVLFMGTIFGMYGTIEYTVDKITRHPWESIEKKDCNEVLRDNATATIDVCKTKTFLYNAETGEIKIIEEPK